MREASAFTMPAFDVAPGLVPARSRHYRGPEVSDGPNAQISQLCNQYGHSRFAAAAKQQAGPCADARRMHVALRDRLPVSLCPRLVGRVHGYRLST